MQKLIHLALTLAFVLPLSATVLPPPTVTSSSPGFQGIYVGSNAVGQGLSEFLSEQGTNTFLEFDFGSARTVDGFVNVTLNLAQRSIGANRLIFDTDGTVGFNAATDTVINFTQAQTGSQGQGFIQRFRAVTAQRVRWEVLAVVGSPSLVGTTEISFLSTNAATVPITGVTVIGSATPFSSQYAAANAANGIAGLGNVAGVEYASLGQNANAYVDFDLGSARAITGFDMFDRLFDAERATSFDLIFSNNADMSSPVATRSYSKASSWTASDTFTTPITARYVRYDITAGSGNTGISEMQFYASEFSGANLGVVVSGAPREVTFNVTGKTGVVSDVTLEWTFNPAQGQAHEAYVELFAPDNTLCDVFRSHVVDDSDIAGPYVFNDAHTALISNAVVSTAGGSVAAGNYRPEYQNVARSFRTTFGGKNPNGVWKLRVQDILSSGFSPTISSANLSIRTQPAPPSIASVAPVVSLLAGGNVTLTGADFSGTPTVTIGGIAATNVTLVNSTTITCTAPVGSVGAKNIVVTNDNGSGTLANGFRYTDLIVTSTADAGSGTLREALSDAQTLSGANTITFAAALSGQTITLTTTPIVIGSGFVTDDTGGVILDASTLSNGLTLTTNLINTRIFYARTGSLTLKNLTIANAGGVMPGGGIFSSATITLERCTLNNNNATGQEGGAIYNHSSATLVQCTLTGNVAGNGAGIHNNGTLTVRHCTIAGNTANVGGGIFMQTGMTLENSIVANNTANAGFDIFNNTPLTRVGANIVPILHTNSGLTGSGSIITSNPLLGAFGLNGGPTRTFPLLAGSPAINAAVGSSITSDQRGQAIVATPDIGAFEAQTTLPVITAPTSAAINYTVATLGGDVTNNGALTLSARGVVFSLTSANNNPAIGGSGVTNAVASSISTGVFTVNLTDLTPGSAYSFRAYAANSLGTSYTTVGSFNTPALPVEINVVPTTAQNYGTQRTGVASVARSFIIENLGNAALTVSSVTVTGGNTGDFVVNTTGMSNSVPALGSTLFTVAFNPAASGARSSTLRIVSNDADEGNTDISLSGIGSNIDMPVIDATPTKINILGVSAVLGGTITSQGGKFVTERGIVIALTSVTNNPYIGAPGTTKVAASSAAGTGSFTATATGLTSGGAYTFRAYATNEGGTSYSNTDSFTTPSSNADLTALATSAGALSPSFTSSGLSYALNVPNTTTSLTVTPTRADARSSIGARVGVDGFAPVTSGNPSGALALVVGVNAVEVQVTAEDGTTKIYALTVTRAASTNASLSALGSSTGALTPAFVSTTFAYTISVADTVTSLQLTPTVQQSNASIAVNGGSVISGQQSSAVSLEYGANAVPVIVTAQDGTTQRTYTITVTRAEPPNTAPSFVIPTATGSVLGAAWTPRLSDASRAWLGVALSADGLRIIACASGPGSLWTSADGGVTWTERTAAGSRGWNGVCSSADGTRLAAIAVSGRIWTSADSGATWTERTGVPVGDWGAIACDSTGLKLIASNHQFGGLTYTSTNQGAAWTARTLPRCLWLASSADGNRLAGFVSGGSLQVSANGGSTWTVTPFSHPGMQDLAMSADGTRIFCAVYNRIHVSSNGGTTFTQAGPDIGFLSLTCSSDGTRAAAISGDGVVYTSSDSGTTWTQTPTKPAGYPRWMRSAGNGSRLITLGGNGILQTSVGSSSSTQTAQAGDPEQTATGFVSSISLGSGTRESTQTVSFNVTNTNNALFSVQPAIAANGTLTYTPAASGSGSTATVSIVAQDSGGTANGGVNVSPAQTFTITISAAANLDLASLTISAGTLAPAFTASVDKYAATVPDTTTSLTVTPTLADTVMKLSVNGSALASGSASNAIPLRYGLNSIAIHVSNATGTRTKEYEVNVTRSAILPTVTDPQFSAVLATQAKLSGNVTADGGSAITERGIVYALTSVNSNPAIGGTGVTKLNAATNDVGSFTIEVFGLAENSNYSFEAYAINAVGTSYSAVQTFQTPVVTRPEIATVSPTASLLAGGQSVGLSGRYFTGATSVTVGGVAATGITVISDTSLTFTAPAGTAGAKDIVVTTSIGSGTARAAYRYVDLTVTSAADSGVGSLREALRNAADVAGSNTITFAPALSGQTIALIPLTLLGTGNDNAFVIDDIGGVIIDSVGLVNGITLTKANPNANCRVFFLRSGTLILRGLTLQGAGGAVPGGAICSSGTLSIERCSLSSNIGGNGGAIYNDKGTLTVAQSTLTRNRAFNGGAIWNDGALTVRHCTIAGNSASNNGGGIAMAKAMTVENSIIAGNSASQGFDIFNNASLTRVGASIVPILHTNFGVTGSGVLLTSDPLLTGLASNGGPTRTMLVQAGSPAINAAIGSSITTDQRGIAISGAADIGAVDVVPVAPVLGLASVSAITSTTATANGIFTSNGGAALSERGFVYSLTTTNSAPIIGGTGVTKLIAAGAGSLTSLTAGSGYSLRAYAINGVGTGYSPTISFTTLGNNTNLSALGLSTGTLSPSFSAATTSYTASVSNSTANITLTPTAADAKATISINGGASSTLPLNVGSNPLTIVVTAEDTIANKTYTVNVTRSAGIPTLGDTTRQITATGLTINCATLDQRGASVTGQGVVFALSSANSTPTLGGTGVTSVAGTLASAAAITTNVNLIAGSTYSYAAYATNSAGTGYSTIGIYTVPVANADLSALATSSGTLLPAFSASQQTYALTTAALTFSVTPTVAATGSTVRVNGGVVGSGSPSNSFPLGSSINTVTIAVTAPNGVSTKTYTIAVSRASAPPVLAPATTKSAVLATNATLGGSITEENGGTITERGIVYALTSANNNPSIGGTGVTKVVGSGPTLGAFSVAVTGLTATSNYTFKAYATNSAGSGYSSVGTFATGNGLANTPPTFDVPAAGVTPAGAAWTQLNNPSGDFYVTGLDVSDDGQRLGVATDIRAIGIYHLSSNGGTTWQNGARSNDQGFHTVAISNNGQNVIIGSTRILRFGDQGQVFTSQNSGLGLGLAYRESDTSAQRLASSDDGKIVFAVAPNGVVRVSRDFGKNGTWETLAVPGNASNGRIACTGDGLKGVLGTASELFTFTTAADGKTVNWTKRNGTGPQNWSSLALSKDGNVIVGSASGGALWVSKDGGVTNWVPYLETPGRPWSQVTCSTDGKVIAAAADGGKVWTYSEASNAWTEQAASQSGNWSALRMSSDGMILYGGVNEQLWKSVGGPAPLTITVNPGSGLFTQPAFCKNISPGVNEANQTVSFNVTTSNNALFRKLPAISADGTLTFAPGTTAGDITVTVTAQDDGGGTDTSSAKTFLIKLRGDDSIGTWASSAWTGDATSGIIADRTLWAYSFGTNSATNVNSVSIPGVPTSTVSNANLDLTGPTSVLSGDANTLTSPLARDFLWGGNPTELKLKDLAIGQAYVLNLLTVGWDGDTANQRLQHFGSGSNVLQLDPAAAGANNGTRVTYTFTANAAERVVRIAQANDNSAGFHLYAAALTISGGATNQAPTNITLSNAAMLEGSAQGDVVGLFSSSDADAQQQHSYALVGGEGSADNLFFAINGKSLILNVTTDRETKSSYSIRVRSTDNGFPKRSFDKVMTITITDLPEPARDIALTPAFFDEGAPADTAFGVLSAIGDPDDATVNYTLMSPDGSYDFGNFYVTTGADGRPRLTTRYFLNADFETKSFYMIRVRGTDRNGGGAFAKDFRVNVVDIDDKPVITGLINSSINEDSRHGVFFTVSDQDSAQNELAMSATSSNTALLPAANIAFGLNPDGKRHVTCTPVANMSGTTTITVTARDGTSAVPIAFDLTVLPVNDAPSFNMPASIALSPNASRSGLASYVTDLNTGPLESSQTMTVTVSYSADSLLFDSTNAPYFRDGVLYAIPKAGQFGTVALTVTLTDGGGTERGGINRFSRTTRITYQSNTSPQNLTFTGSTLVENSPAGTVVGTLSATDPESHTLTFSLTGTGNDNAGFEINNTTRTLVTKAGFVPNFEAKSTLAVVVRVTDSGTPAASIEKTFTINVTDANDAPAALTATSQFNQRENQGPDVELPLVFRVTDPDLTQTHTLSLVGTGNDNAFFKFNGNKLFTAQNFDFETKPTLTYLVRATDNGGQFIEQNFTVNVTNVNEPPTNISLVDTTGAAINMEQPEGVFFYGGWDPNYAHRDFTPPPGRFFWDETTPIYAGSAQGMRLLNIIGTFKSTDPESGSTFKYEIVPDETTDYREFYIFERRSWSQVSGSKLTGDFMLRRVNYSFWDYESSKRSYTVKIRATDNGLNGRPTTINGLNGKYTYLQFNYFYERPKSFEKTLTFTVGPQDEETLFQDLGSAQHAGRKSVDVFYAFHDPETPTVNVSIEWSSDDGATWKTPNAANVTGAIGSQPGSKRKRGQYPINDAGLSPEDTRLIKLNVGNEWNGQLTQSFKVRLTAGTRTFTSGGFQVDTRGDGPMTIWGYVFNKLTGQPYVPARNSPPITITLGNRSTQATTAPVTTYAQYGWGVSVQKAGYFKLTNCAPGRLTVSHPLYVKYEKDIGEPDYGQEQGVGDFGLTPDTDPPVVHKVTMLQAGGTLGGNGSYTATDRGIALSGFGVKSQASIDMNWGKARATGAIANGDAINIYLNVNPNVTTDELRTKGKAFQTVAGQAGINFKSNLIDYDAQFTATTQAGANNIAVIARNELGQWSDKPEIVPIYVLPLPKPIEFLSPRGPGRVAYTNDHLGFDFGSADLSKVVDYPIIGKWGVEFSTSGSFDYTMSDGNWELAYRGGDLVLFGNQYLNRKINRRPGYKSPYLYKRDVHGNPGFALPPGFEKLNDDEKDEPINLANILIPKDQFEIKDGKIQLKGLWADASKGPRIALYMGDREIEAAFFAAAVGQANAFRGLELNDIEGALIIRRSGPVAEVNLGLLLGLPPKIGKYISPTLTLSAAIDQGGSAKLGINLDQVTQKPTFKLKDATVTGGIDLRLALSLDKDVAGIEGYIGGALKGRLGYPSPLLRELSGRIYAGYEWYVLFLSGRGQVTLGQFNYQAADDPALKATAAHKQVLALSKALPASTPNQINLGLPDMAVVGQITSRVGPMKRRWRENGPEHFQLHPVAAPTTRSQAVAARAASQNGSQAKLIALAAPAPTSNLADTAPELDMFNRMGRPAKNLSDFGIQKIIDDPTVPAQAVLPLIQNIFPRARQALADSNGKLMLIYTRDTSADNPIHFTEIAYTYYNGTSWTAPGALAADPRGQTAPQIRADGSGNFVATWTQLKDLAFDGTGGLDAQATQAELVASTWDAGTGLWSAPVAITDNSVLDHQAKLAGPLADGDLLLSWTRNNGNQSEASEVTPDDVLSARWDAATQSWGPAAPVVSGLTSVTSCDFSAAGNTAIYTYTTEESLQTITWTNGTWAAPVEVASNATFSTARIIVQASGDTSLLYKQNDDLYMIRNASPTPQLVRQVCNDNGWTDFAFTAGPNGNLIVMWSGNIDANYDAFYRIYSANNQHWSTDTRLSNDFDIETAFTPVWDAQGNLIIAYHNTELLRQDKEVTLDDGTQATVEGALVPGQTNLLLARRLLTTDLSVRNLAAASDTWGPGSAVTLTVELNNTGNFPISGASISLYDGDPLSGGTLITTLAAPSILEGADTFEASYDWVIPGDETTQYRIYAVADATNTVAEFNETNNTASRRIGGYDLKLEYISGRTFPDGTANIAVRVTNLGSPASPVSRLRLWAAPERGAEPISAMDVTSLDPSFNTELGFTIPAANLKLGANTFEISVNDDALQDEPNAGNNATSFSLTIEEPASPITGLSDLAVTAAELSPSFLTSTLSYSTDVPFDQSTVSVVPTALHFGSTITVNGTPVISGTASAPIALNSGSTQIVIEVTSQNGANKMSYSVTVHRGVAIADDSGNGSLRALIAAAALRGGPDVIALGRALDGQTISLTSPILINDPNGVVIDGSALENGVTIEGSGNHRLFEVAANSSLTLICVTLKNGGGTSFASNGGAILNNGTLRIQRSTLIGNKAVNGGAVHNTSTGTTTMTQTTFAENTASSAGGALLNEGTATVSFSTLSTNVGGAVRSTGTLSVENSILANNSGTDLDSTGAIALSYRGANIVRSTSGITATGPAPLTSQPLLSELGRFGGPTQTFVPGVGSPAIDAALASSSMSVVDQRGYARTQGSQPDLGSTEGRVLIVTTALDEYDAAGAVGAGYSLREAVRDAEPGATILFDRAIFSGSTATTNTITLTKGPLNPQNNISLNGTQNPGGIIINAALGIITQPVSQRIGIGGSATFKVVPNAVNGGVKYQWRRDGIAIGGAVSDTLQVPNATTSDTCVVDCVLDEAEARGAVTLVGVTFDFGQIVSQPASLIVGISDLKIVHQPESAILPLGSAWTLSTVAVGPAAPAMTYQWYANGKSIAGATMSTLTLLKMAFTNAGAYSCAVTSGTSTVISSTAEVAIVDTAPKTVNIPIAGTFTPVISAAGNGLTFLWKRNGAEFGQTGNTFTIKPLVVSDAGLYTCEVTNIAGTLKTGFNTTLNVAARAPQLGSITLPPAYIGQSYYYQLPVLPIAGAAATSFTVAGALPAGITLNASTGVLSGRPTATKTGGYALSFTASNGATLKSAARNATLIVNAIDARALGTFAGPAPRSALNGNLGGRFDLTTTVTGTFSGSVTLGSRAAIRFTNVLLQVSGAGDQVLTGTITGIAMADTAKTPLAALVEVFVADQTARLTLTHPNGTQLIIPAWRNPWTKTLTASAYATNYTLRLDAGQGGETSPDGYGFASFSIGADGIVKLSGKLPDGNIITAGGFVGSRGQVLVFQTLYKNAGSLVGQFDITRAVPVTTNLLTGLLSWSKPRVTTDLIYKDGFAPLSVKVEGSAYVRPNAGQRLLGLPAVSGNALLDFRLGALSEGWSQPITIVNPSPTGLTNTASVPPTAANGLKVAKLDAATGTFSGSFTLAGTTALLNRPATYEGMIVKVGTVTQGYGFFHLPKVPVGTEKVTTAPRLSGVVELSAP